MSTPAGAADEAPMIRLDQLRFAYGRGGFALEVDELSIERAAHVACIGPSGTGKSTLVNLVAGILVPDSGRVEVGGVCVSELSEAARRARRLATIGMVFQELELLEYLSAFDNVLLPYRLSKHATLDEAVRERARALCEAVGIAHLLTRRPRKLSQGERQRVAIARALVTQPQLVLCDEPTGNLDPDTARQTLDLLFEQARAHDATLLMVTHDHSILTRFDRTVDMRELCAPGAGAPSR